MTPTKCEGSCEEHEGEIKRYNVVHKASGHDWGEFDYCYVAYKEDIRRGMELTIIKDGSK